MNAGSGANISIRTLTPDLPQRVESLGVDVAAPATGNIAVGGSLQCQGGISQTPHDALIITTSTRFAIVRYGFGSISLSGESWVLSTGGKNVIVGQGIVTPTTGFDTRVAAKVSTPAVVSGTAFTPSATTDAMVYIQTNAKTAGSYKITMGPTTGAEHAVATTVAQVVGSDDVTTVRVPAGWKMVVTVTSVTLSSVTVVTC